MLYDPFLPVVLKLCISQNMQATNSYDDNDINGGVTNHEFGTTSSSTSSYSSTENSPK
jgi:hypothetical protein